MIAYVGKSNCGATHTRNDDRVFLVDEMLSGAEEPGTSTQVKGHTSAERVLACAFDGVGGSHRGDLAAAAAAVSLRDGIAKDPDVSLEHLLDTCAADVSGFQGSLDHSQRAYTCGAGIELIQSDEGALVTPFHAGDCRVYRYRAPHLDALTVDHSLANRYREEMGPDYEVPANIAHVVTRYAGGEIEDPFEIGHSLPCQNGDLYLMCSDGLWEYVDADLLEGFLSLANATDPASLEVALDNLVRTAAQNGSPDDISGALLAWTQDER
jgi:serine/threonine protein phosphatase PrpC